MSFRFGPQVITLDNYKEVFKVCSSDILDEIRLAILDDVPIGPYIQLCEQDYYKLNQIRKAIREMIPSEYLNISFSHKILKSIREGLARGHDMSSLLNYANSKGVLIEVKSLETIADFMSNGVNLDMLDFRKVPTHQVELFCKGVLNNYPMWLLLGNKVYSESYIRLLMRGMQLGLDIHPFLGTEWEEGNLLLLFSFANKVNINDILTKITAKFPSDTLRILLNLAAASYDIDELCKRDKEGYPIFNTFQIDALSNAVCKDTLTREMLNPNLSAKSIQDLVDKT